MRVCKKLVIYLGIKTPQSRKERKSVRGNKKHVYRVAGMTERIRGKTARISCHNFETDHNLEHLKCPCSVYLT